MIRVTRQYRFSASHRLHSPRLSPEQNAEIYGKCNNPFGHGHDYVIQVQASGPVDPETGLALDVRRLDGLVESALLADFANANLNDLAVFAETSPTTENLARESECRLRRAWRSVFADEWPRLEGVRILETRRNVIETEGMRA